MSNIGLLNDIVALKGISHIALMTLNLDVALEQFIMLGFEQWGGVV